MEKIFDIIFQFWIGRFLFGGIYVLKERWVAVDVIFELPNGARVFSEQRSAVPQAIHEDNAIIHQVQEFA